MRNFIKLGLMLFFAGVLVVSLAVVGCETGDKDSMNNRANAGEKETEKPKKDPAQAFLDENCKSFFHKSLHATGEGMRKWYEEEGGFMNVTKMPYKDLGCKNCHACSCDRCHAEKKEDGTMTFSVARAGKKELCLECHSRAKVTFKFDTQQKIDDVHMSQGFQCTECHKSEDIHGDGKKYSSMRDEGAVKAKCTNCHSMEDLEKDKDKNRSHKKHLKNIDCAACHVSNTLTCYNCHFDKFLETGKKPGNFVPAKDWLLLVNYKGKVTSGNIQSLVYKGKKFVAYVPYFTHSVPGKGRACGDCHGTDAAKTLAEGKEITVTTWNAEQKKVDSIGGVIPYAEGKLRWLFLDKKDGEWIPMDGTKPDFVQNAAYAEPLTEKQLKLLAKPYK